MGWLSALEGRGSPLADRDPVIVERRGTGVVDPARDCDAHEQVCACRERLVLEETTLRGARRPIPRRGRRYGVLSGRRR